MCSCDCKCGQVQAAYQPEQNAAAASSVDKDSILFGLYPNEGMMNECALNQSLAANPSFAPSLQCPYPGLVAEILNTFVSTTPYINASFRLLDSRAIPDLVESLLSGEVDCIGELHIMANEYMNYGVKFSQPLYKANGAFLLREPQPKLGMRMSQIFGPFRVDMWLGVLLFIGIFVLIALLIGRFAQPCVGMPPYKKYWNVIRQVVPNSSAGQIKQLTRGGQLMSIVAGLSYLLFLALYQRMLLAGLLHTPAKDSFSGFGDVLAAVRSADKRLVTLDEHWYFGRNVRTSNKTQYALLRHAAYEAGAPPGHPIAQAADTDGLMRMLKSGAYTSYMTEVVAEHYLHNFDPLCILQKMPCDLYYVPVAFMCRPNVSLAGLDEAIGYSRTRIYSIVQKYEYSQSPSAGGAQSRRCHGASAKALQPAASAGGGTGAGTAVGSASDLSVRIDRPGAGDERPPTGPSQWDTRRLSWETLLGLFIIFLGGLLLSALVFAAEYVCALRRSK